MEPRICPYVGIRDDPQTSLSFPSEGNACHRAIPVSGILAEHQKNYCLSENHIHCPVFLGQTNTPPQPVASPPAVTAGGWVKRIGLLVLLPLLLLTSGVVFASWWTSDGHNLDFTWLTPKSSGDDTHTSEGLPGFLGLPNGAASQGGSTATPFQPFASSGAVATPDQRNCPVPDGWVVYIVKPTDSVSFLSLIFGISADQLRQANCLVEDTLLRPGEALYVPNIPTRTPSATSTISAEPTYLVPQTGGFFRPTWTLTPPPETSNPVPAPQNPSSTSAPSPFPTVQVVVPTVPIIILTPTLQPTEKKSPTSPPPPTPRPTQTHTKQPTRTPSPRPSDTLSPTNTLPPTRTPTLTQVPTEIQTPTEGITTIPTAKPTDPEPTNTTQPPDPTNTSSPPDPTNTTSPPDPTNTTSPPEPTSIVTTTTATDIPPTAIETAPTEPAPTDTPTIASTDPPTSAPTEIKTTEVIIATRTSQVSPTEALTDTQVVIPTEPTTVAVETPTQVIEPDPTAGIPSKSPTIEATESPGTQEATIVQ